MSVCIMCSGNKFTFSEYRGGYGAAACGCCEPQIRREFEENPSERASIIRRYAITEEAIKIANALPVSATKAYRIEVPGLLPPQPISSDDLKFQT